jgi:hypothetical protein
MEINISKGEINLPRWLRLAVVILLPWLALWVARKQLRLACLILRNEARRKYKEDETLLRWADELENDGNMKP